MSPDAPEEITEAIRTAIEYEGFPRGENFDSDIAKWRCLRQLSWGYYLVWDWGDRGPDTDWLITRAAWRRVLYQELQYRSDQGYDSPLLVTRKVQRDIATNQKLTQLHHLWMGLGWAAAQNRHLLRSLHGFMKVLSRRRYMI